MEPDLRRCPDAVRHFATALVETEAEIISGYRPPFGKDTLTRVVVRCGEWWLRHSKGPRTGTFWDIYGDDFLNVDIARAELAKAPPVPEGKPYREYVISLGAVEERTE